jgi:hypothetical protein
MNKVFYILILVLPGAFNLYAQQPVTKKEVVSKPVLSIATSPLSLIEIEPTANLQVMYLFNSKYSAAIEVGRIFKRLNDYEDDDFDSFNHFTGWRFRPEFRFLSTSLKTRQRTFYMAVQGLLKFAEEKSNYWVERTTPSGLPYREAVVRTVDKTVTGVSFLVGEDMSSINTNKTGIDFYTGLGLRYKHFKDNLGSDFNSNYGFLNNRNGFYPTVIVGFRIRLKVN